jgi:hypothetical protein
MVQANEFVEINISGDTQERVTGDCYLLQKSGRLARQKIESKIPAKFWLPTSAARCNFQKINPVLPLIFQIKRGQTIELEHKSKPPFRWIVIRSSGPWGKAMGSNRPSRPIFRP